MANVEPVTAETALKLGRAAAHVITQLGRGQGRANARPTIALGKDTRQSGYMLEDALAAGLMSLGVDVLQLGPLPTPGVAYITRSLRCDAGIVLTASHNPYEDNGIKFFHHDGYKLEPTTSNARSRTSYSAAGSRISARPPGRSGARNASTMRWAATSNLPRRASRASLTLDKLRIAVDVANGAGYKSTPWILRELGADVLTFHNNPDGTNINRDCGSTHPSEIQLLVRQTGAGVGITHDGDADRVLLCDEKGQLVDGDEIMAIAAREFLRQGRLTDNTLVATVMSNYGLEESLGECGGKVIRAQVGDRYVIEEMVKGNLNLGGEQSGHMIFRDFTTTGDGIITALQVLRIMRDTGKPLSELKQCLAKYPQAQRNLRVTRKPALTDLPEVSKLVAETEGQLGGKGRVLLRYSGTEPKVRLLIEGRDQALIEKQADRIADALMTAIGS